MNKNLKRAIVALLQEKEIVSSWGISNILIKESAFSFQVDGFIYNGSICIMCNASYCEVEFDNGKTIRCNVHDLLNVLDTIIEKDKNYLLNLEEWLASRI